MGRDKYENEQLIEFGHKEDLWFHVDDLSSAHVYLRTPWSNPSPSSIPDDVLEEMCQLVKNNSIEGCKSAQVDIVFTPWSNLRKDSSMDVGQVGFHDQKMCHYSKDVKTKKDIVKRIEKTKTEKSVDLRQSRQDRDREEVLRQKAVTKQMHSAADEAKRVAIQQQKLKSYESMFKDIEKHRGQKVEAADTIEGAKMLEEDALW